MQYIYKQAHILFKIECMGRQITEKFKKSEDNEVVFLVFLKGAAMFASDLLKNIEIDKCRVEYIFNNKDMKQQMEELFLTGKHVVILEDIVDTGKTIKKAKDILDNLKIMSLTVASLLIRNDERIEDVDFYCFKLITPEFVIGYGMDLDENYRNLPHICVNDEF